MSILFIHQSALWSLIFTHLTDVYEAPTMCKAQGNIETKDWLPTSTCSQFSARYDSKYAKTLECY